METPTQNLNKTAVYLALMGPVLAFQGWIFSTAWEWLIVPTWALAPHLNTPKAAAVIWVGAWFKRGNKSEQTLWERFFQMLANAAIFITGASIIRLFL